tara:strand:+ start:1235 stop:1408 length:174 start_codon:yes stop_codon:yes gene_type:complete
VDLSKLRPKIGDFYPVSLIDRDSEEKDLLRAYRDIYERVLDLNFDGSAWEPADRLYD